MNKKGFTLVELVISAMILAMMAVALGIVIKQTIIFVDYSKNRFAVMSEISSIKQSIGEIFLNKQVKIIEQTLTGQVTPYSLKDNALTYEIDNIGTTTKKNATKDILILNYKNNTSSGTYIIGMVDKLTKKLLPIESDSSGLFGFTELQSLTMTGIFEQEFVDYTNNTLNILEFKYTLLNSGSALRLDIKYDNNLDGNLGVDEEDYGISRKSED